MSDRAASSPFVRDVPAAEASAAWAAARRAAGCPEHVETVTVPVTQALGRVTAGPVWARRSSPDYDAAAMDGIAVTATDTYGASESRPLLLTAEQFDVVDTGDPMPDGRDAVVMREHVHHTAEGAELRAAVAPWTHVRSIGEDVAATELLLPAGHRLRPYDLAAAAAAGVPELLVRRAPRVTVIPTGDEIRPVGQPLGPGEIPETNSVMLAGQAVLLRRRRAASPTSYPTCPPSWPPPFTRPRPTATSSSCWPAPAPAATTGPRAWSRARACSPSTGWPCGPGTPSCSASSTRPRCSALRGSRCRPP